jgi:hypothetical protein
MADVMVALKRPDRKCAARLSNYDRERAFFSVRPPERFNPVVDILDRWAADDPNALCVVSVDGNRARVGRRMQGATTSRAGAKRRESRPWHVTDVIIVARPANRRRCVQ